MNIGVGIVAMGKFTDISHVVLARRWGLLPFFFFFKSFKRIQLWSYDT